MKTHNNKGIAIFITLALLFLLSLIVTAVLLTAYNYANISAGQINRLKALKLAESGVNYAYWKIRIGKDDAGDDITYPCTLNPDPSNPSLVPAGWTLNVDVTNDNPRRIQSRVTYPKSGAL
ncbi:MAG: hypothetical protein Q7O04_03740 [Candidatus Omnitrophota bacterium]|nr:hypothetical protein [Candidatus Omnitrophota bacterium]